MFDTQTTIVVVPRERFSHTRQSLESIYENTKIPFKLVYVDGGSPNNIRVYLEKQASKRNFHLIRTNHYLSPNQARNIGLSQVNSKYVVFIDNDVEVTSGWLNALVQCAEGTNASIVGPLYFIGDVDSQIIHMAGGEAHIKELQNGKKILFERHRYAGKPLAEVSIPQKAELTDVMEFHCMLVRTEVFEKVGFLDEGLLNTREHVDFCLTVSQAGGSIYFEPKSVITYVPPSQLELSDLPFFALRWGEHWTHISWQHLQRKWNVEFVAGDLTWLRRRRQSIILKPLQNKLCHQLGDRFATSIGNKFLVPMELIFSNYLTQMYAPRKRQKIKAEGVSNS
jgi:GT2 family glycosyltransferase